MGGFPGRGHQGITSRQPSGLDAICAKIIEEIAEGHHTKRSAAALMLRQERCG
jgi:hypothetical protein